MLLLFEVNYLVKEIYRLNITAEDATDASKEGETMKERANAYD